MYCSILVVYSMFVYVRSLFSSVNDSSCEQLEQASLFSFRMVFAIECRIPKRIARVFLLEVVPMLRVSTSFWSLKASHKSWFHHDFELIWYEFVVKGLRCCGRLLFCENKRKVFSVFADTLLVFRNIGQGRFGVYKTVLRTWKVQIQPSRHVTAWKVCFPSTCELDRELPEAGQTIRWSCAENRRSSHWFSEVSKKSLEICNFL